MGRRPKVFGAFVAAAMLLAGCSGTDEAPSPSASSSGPGPSTAATTASPTPVVTGSLDSDGPDEATARRILSDYLVAWRDKGPVLASTTFLTPDEQATTSDDSPKITKGMLVSVEDPARTADGRRYLVTLDLTFDGDPGAWSTGRNERFVTFVPRAEPDSWEMTFATGP